MASQLQFYMAELLSWDWDESIAFDKSDEILVGSVGVHEFVLP